MTLIAVNGGAAGNRCVGAWPNTGAQGFDPTAERELEVWPEPRATGVVLPTCRECSSNHFFQRGCFFAKSPNISPSISRRRGLHCAMPDRAHHYDIAPLVELP
jgi:hypothetical protein